MRCLLILSMILSPLTQLVIAQCDREQMVEDYQQYIMGTQVTAADLAWTGDAANCSAGEVSAMSIENSMQRINYFRRLAGVSSALQYDSSLEAMCQEAALMMHSENRLSHDPENSWSCYTEDGKKAASKSNLALGTHSVNALTLYMRDPGVNNFAVGHRRWILFSRGKDIGLGSTSRAHVMYVIHNRQDPPDDLQYITYPSEGYFPAPLVPDRWSFGLPRAKFGDAEVVMWSQDGEEIPLDVLEVKNGFGDNTLVWEPDQAYVDKYAEDDRQYIINVNHVVLNKDTLDYSYTVTIAPTVYPPVCPDGFTWLEDQCECSNQQTTNLRSLDKESPLKIYPNPAHSFVTLELPNEILKANQEAHVQISASDGKILKQLILDQTVTHLDISDLTDGIYFCRLVSGDWISSQILVVGR